MSLPQEDPKFESVFSKLRREHNSESPPKTSKPSENNSTRNNRNTKSQSPGDSEPFSSFSSDFYNKGRKDRGNRPPRPKLSERLFSNRKVGGGSVFEDPLFVNDLRKELDNERKMFFDGVDPFGHFPSPRSRGTSPQPATGGGGGSARVRFSKTIYHLCSNSVVSVMFKSEIKGQGSIRMLTVQKKRVGLKDIFPSAITTFFRGFDCWRKSCFHLLVKYKNSEISRGLRVA